MATAFCKQRHLFDGEFLCRSAFVGGDAYQIGAGRQCAHIEFRQVTYENFLAPDLALHVDDFDASLHVSGAFQGHKASYMAFKR